MVNVYKIEPAFKKENGLWCLDLDRIKLPKGFKCLKKYLLYFPPQTMGGNHKHNHTEIFIGLGKDMELHWLNKDGKKQKAKMQPKNTLFAFQISPGTAHAVINKSKKEKGILIEFAAAVPNNLEPVEVI